MAKAKKKATGLRVNFEGVEGKRSTLPDDDYLVEVEAAEEKEGSNHPYIELTLVVQSGPHKGSKIWDRASTSPGALWRLRSLLEVMGLEVPDGAMDIDTDDLVGTTFMAVTAQEKYKNDDGEKKVAVRMVDFYPAEEGSSSDDAEEVEEEDDEPAPKKKGRPEKPAKGKKGKKVEEEEDDEEAEEADSEDEDEEEEETPAEKKKRLRKERRDKRKGKGGDDDDADEPAPKKGKGKKAEEEEDDDEEDEPAPKAKKGKKKAKVTADAISEMDEEELTAFIEEHELEVDLDDYKTLRKKAAAVTDAAEEADLIEADED